MLYKVYKVIFADMEKEESWLNEMAQKGINFIDNFLVRYTFTEGIPNEYIYRIELLEHKPSHPLSQRYISFLKETGVECVSTSGRWAYFRRKTVDGPFDLYSDLDARIEHYKRNISYVFMILMFNLVVLGLNIMIGLTKKSPGSIGSSLSVLFFTGILIKTLFHYRKKVKTLKQERRIHE